MRHGADVVMADEGCSSLDDDLRETFRRRLDDELRVMTSERSAAEPDLEAALDDQANETVDAVRSAIARLDEGTYGRCVECESYLPVARLMALPHASRCLDCQIAAERRR